MSFLSNLTLRNKELLTGFSILFIILGSFFSAEVILRYKQMQAFGETGSVEEMSTFYKDKKTGLRVAKPNSSMGSISFNSYGFRGPKLSKVKTDDIIRLGFLGNSIVFDAYSPIEENTWTALISDKFQNLFPQCKIEYFNAGLPGLSSSEAQLYYENFIKQASPDLLFIMTDDRNIILDDIAIDTGVHDGVHYRPSWLSKHSLFWKKLEKNIIIQARLREAVTQKNKLIYNETQVIEKYSPSVNKLINSIKTHDTIPVLLSMGQKLRAEQPLEMQLKSIESTIFFMPYMKVHDFIYSLELYNRATIKIAQENNIAYLEWHNDLEGSEDNFHDARHFTAQGSMKLGAILSNQINVEHKIINQLKSKNFSCMNKT